MSFRLRDKHELKAWNNDTECSGIDQKMGVTGIEGVERSAWSPSRVFTYDETFAFKG